MTPQQLRSELDAADMSPSELARRLDMHHSTVFRWLAGHRNISRWMEPHIRKAIEDYLSDPS